MFREIVGRVMRTFVLVNTGILFAVAVFTTIIYPQEKISSAMLWQIPVAAMVTSLETLIYPVNRSMGRREGVLRILLHYLSVIAAVLFCGWQFAWYDITDRENVLYMLLSITLIFAGVSVVVWGVSASAARKMNEKLQELKFKKNVDKGHNGMYNKSVRENKSRESDT